MANFEKMVGDIAICLSDMASFATELQPSSVTSESPDFKPYLRLENFGDQGGSSYGVF